MLTRRTLVWSCALAVACTEPAAWARPQTPRGSEGPGTRGRPSVTLERLDLSLAPRARAAEPALREALARAARQVDWGAGRGARIQYRYRVDDLSATESNGVLTVRCSATGWLPRGKSARGHLSFGGSPKDETALVRHVLEIVAEGVVTRLAQIEHQRRTQ